MGGALHPSLQPSLFTSTKIFEDLSTKWKLQTLHTMSSFSDSNTNRGAESRSVMDALLRDFVSTLGSCKPDVLDRYLFSGPTTRVLSRNHPYHYGLSFIIETKLEHILAAEDWDFCGVTNHYMAMLQIPVFPQGMCYSVIVKAHHWFGQKEESKLEVHFQPRHHSASHTPSWEDIVNALQQKQAAARAHATKIHSLPHSTLLSSDPNNHFLDQMRNSSMLAMISNEENSEAEDILDCQRVGRNGQLQYCTPWVGHELDPNWCPAEEPTNSQDLLDEFHKAYPKKHAPMRELLHSGLKTIKPPLGAIYEFPENKLLLGPVIQSLSISYTPVKIEWFEEEPSLERIGENKHRCALFNFISNLNASQFASHDILNDRHFRYVRQLANSPSSEYGIGVYIRVIKNRIKQKGVVAPKKSWMVAAGTCEYGGGFASTQMKAQLFVPDVPEGTSDPVVIWELLIFRLKEQLRSYDKHARSLRNYVEEFVFLQGSEDVMEQSY